jgi:hypothetical protein
MIDFLDKNKEWIFSGVGITLFTLAVICGRGVLAWFFQARPTVRVSAGLFGNGLTPPVRLLTITSESKAESVKKSRKKGRAR